VKQFVTLRESGIERRPKPWNVKMALHRGGDQRGGARYAYAPGRSSAVFFLAAWVTGIVVAIASLLS